MVTVVAVVVAVDVVGAVVLTVATVTNSTTGHWQGSGSASGQVQVRVGQVKGLTFGQGPALGIGQSRKISLRSRSIGTYFVSVSTHCPENKHVSKSR